MDCFACPRGKNDEVEIPYLGSDSYDGGCFTTFNERSGFADDLSRLLHVQTEPVTESKLRSFHGFLQDWMFLGLLSEVFQEPVLSQHYTTVSARPESGGILKISTSNLPSKFQDLIVQGRMLSDNQRVQRAQSLEPYLDRVRDVLRLVSTSIRLPDMEEPLLTFLGLLYELTAAVTGAAFTEGRVYYGELHGSLELTSGAPYAIRRLRDQNWCPRVVWSLIKKYNTTLGYYASFLDEPGGAKNHTKCTSLVCTAYNVDNEAAYDYQHLCADAKCEFVPVNTADVIHILRNQHIPVVQIVDATTNPPQIAILEASSSVPYIAISHVWSDGLGNPFANSMPACQIRRMADLCRSPDGTSIPVWIDTLCCPTEPDEATDLAISLMRKTYSEAAAVIVIDGWLSTQKSSAFSSEDIMLLIMLSGWTRRLWTFQEGMLARQVWVLFSDGLFQLNEIARAVRNSLECRFLPMKSYLVKDYMRLQGLAKAHGTGRQILHFLVDSLRFRSTSVETDEALCLATILDLDFDTIMKDVPEQRMRQVWLLLHDIPQDIIFLDSPKLQEPGLGWAPTTLRMPTGTENLFSQLAWDMGKPSGIFYIGKGLEVQYDGLLLGTNTKTNKTLGLDMRELRIADFGLVDQNRVSYKSEFLTRAMKVWLSDFRGASHCSDEDFDTRQSSLQLTDEDLTDFRLPADLDLTNFVILVRSFDKDLVTADADIGLLCSFQVNSIPGTPDEKLLPNEPTAVSSLGHVTVRRSKSRLQHKYNTDASDIQSFGEEEEESSSKAPNATRQDLTPIYKATYLPAHRWCVG